MNDLSPCENKIIKKLTSVINKCIHVHVRAHELEFIKIATCTCTSIN